MTLDEVSIREVKIRKTWLDIAPTERECETVYLLRAGFVQTNRGITHGASVWTEIQKSGAQLFQPANLVTAGPIWRLRRFGSKATKQIVVAFQ